MELSKHLKEATQELHQVLESLPFHQALRERTLSPVSTKTLLRALAIVHAAVEKELTACGDERVRSVARRASFKSGLIRADLQRWADGAGPDNDGAILSALELAQAIREKSAPDPFWLAGFLYTLEGSQNGGLFLKKMIQECPGQLELTCLGAYGPNTGTQWKAFTSGLDELELSEQETRQVEAGALAAFEGFEKIMRPLHPYTVADLRYHVSAVNPEAGNHATPQTPEEIELAAEAGRRAWAKYPYLQARFAERGKRFTGSDSCWLLTLVPLPLPAIRKNVYWLRDLLSVRGIPGMILETHLGEMRDLLHQTWPERKETFTNFDLVLHELAEERRARINEDRLKRIKDEFEPLLQVCAGKQVPGVPAILASAWADEQNGVKGAFSAVKDWLLDPVRFSSDWSARVSELSENISGERP